MLRHWVVSAIFVAQIAPQYAATQEDRERRLETVTITTLPPDMGELHINPVVRRPLSFARPGFTEMELVFVPVALIGEGMESLVEEDSRDYLKLTTALPDRPDGTPFEDTPKDYLTQSVVLPRGYYVLSEISFRQTLNGETRPDLEKLSLCLEDETFMLHVKGGDVMFMGLIDFIYPTAERLKDPAFNPARMALDDLGAFKGWRWTTKDLEHFTVTPTTFERSDKFCDPQSLRPGS